MTPDELREKVARAIERSLLTAQLRDAFEHPYTAEADAAIAVALEEVARVFDDMWGGITPDEIAAAIRAMIPQTTRD